jgi:hypothetical protein
MIVMIAAPMVTIVIMRLLHMWIIHAIFAKSMVRYEDKDDSYDVHRKDKDKAAHIASYGVDTNWYTDSGATNHITGKFSKLSTHDKYTGRDHVHTANDTGMKISHIGHSMLHTPSSSLHLNNILHVPHTSKNLLFVHKLTIDNNVFIELHPFLFLLRIGQQGQLCLKERVVMVFTC